MTATSLLCRLILSSASSAFSHGRSLLQTDLTTTNPALSVCGSVVSGSDLTIGSGASVDVDTSCTYGSESWDISGTTTTYTTRHAFVLSWEWGHLSGCQASPPKRIQVSFLVFFRVPPQESTVSPSAYSPPLHSAEFTSLRHTS